MSQENVEIVRTVIDAWNANDFDRFLAVAKNDSATALS